MSKSPPATDAGRLGEALTLMSSEFAADDYTFANHAGLETVPTAHHAGDRCLSAGFNLQHLQPDTLGRLRWVQNAEHSGAALLAISLMTCHNSVLTVGFLFSNATLPRRYEAERALRDGLRMLEHFVSMAWQLELTHLRLTGAQAALDRCDMGVVLLSADESVIFENCEARALLDTGIGIRRAGRSIAANDMQGSVRLRVAIERVALRDCNASQGMPTFALRRGKTQRPLLVSVVAPPQAPTAHSGSVAAILYLFDPDRDFTYLLNAACRLYGLTPVESGLATELVCGSTLAEAATSLRVKEMTARGYLKQVFVKTGVNRQSALVRLMMSSVIRLTANIELEVI